MAQNERHVRMNRMLEHKFAATRFRVKNHSSNEQRIKVMNNYSGEPSSLSFCQVVNEWRPSSGWNSKSKGSVIMHDLNTENPKLLALNCKASPGHVLPQIIMEKVDNINFLYNTIHHHSLFFLHTTEFSNQKI